jgi:hypothetical protein
MNENSIDIKKRLTAGGQWPAFVKRRQELAAEGEAPARAYVLALAEIDGIPAPPEQRAAPVRMSATGLKGAEGALLSFPVSREMFSGKKESTARADLEFVYNSIDLEDVEPEDAPSAGAWGLLCRVRALPALQVEFYTSMWPKLLPSRASLEETPRDTISGLIGLVDEIKKGTIEANAAAARSAGGPAA